MNFAIVLLTSNHIGGAEKRFINLFRYLYEKESKNNFYYFVTHYLFNSIRKIYPDYPLDNVIPLGKKGFYSKNAKVSYSLPISSKIRAETTYPSFIMKLFRAFKSYKIEYDLYKEINGYRKAYKIDVFMGVYSGIFPLYFYLKKRKRKAGIIFSDMDGGFDHIYRDMKKFWYKKYVSLNYGLKNCDHIDFLSPYLLEGVMARGIELNKDRISVTPCSFTNDSKCRVSDKSKFQVAFASRLEEYKSPLLFLDAAIELSMKYPEICFHIMGEGRLTQVIIDKCKMINSRKIIFHGFLANPTDIFAETSVFVSIQTRTNYPSQSVLEAMACGNAIIASDVGDTRMFINEKNGILIDLNRDALVKAIEYLYLNQEKTKELGLYAEKYVKENHTIKRSADYYLELFHKVLKNKS